MQIFNESYAPKRVAASGQIVNPAGNLGGMFCVAAGTVTIRNGPGATDTVIIDTFPVSIGVYYSLPFTFPNGAYADIAGGAVVIVGANN